ncbi:MAG TPA: helix-turn-helix transcriptional regulator [Solirubrobacterales bacterium]|nr:helix-turn-helix transcriptional regulator [Solirubrobacterales bacterium]
MSLNERFSANLRRAREAAGMTQAELSRRVEVHPSHVCFWENGRRMPRLDTLVKLVSVLDCRADELIEGMVWRPNVEGYGSFEVEV